MTAATGWWRRRRRFPLQRIASSVATSSAVIPREGGVASKPRPFDSIISVSGILGRPPSRAMTGGGVDESSRQRVRHCERSEAIHLTAKRNNGLLRRFAPRNDGEHKPAFSRRESARVLLTIALEKQEAAGNAGCAVHPRPRVQQKAHALATTGTPPPAFPARWFTAYIALSPGTGLFCPRRSADKSANLNASVGHQDHTTSPSASAPLV